MTPTELKNLILGLANDHPAKVAFLAAEDATCAAELGKLALPGPVPIREVASYCINEGVTGALQAVDSIPIGTEIAFGTTMTLQFKGLLKNVLTLLVDDFRLETCDVLADAFATACDGLILLHIMTTDQKAALIAMSANRLPLASVSAFDVGNARNLG